MVNKNYNKKKKIILTSPFAITISTIPSWIKYIFDPIVPSLIIISPIEVYAHNDDNDDDTKKRNKRE